MAVTAACKPPQLCSRRPVFVNDNRSTSLTGRYWNPCCWRAVLGMAVLTKGMDLLGRSWLRIGRKSLLGLWLWMPLAVPARRTKIKSLCVTIPVVFYCCCCGRRRNRTLIIGMFGIHFFPFFLLSSTKLAKLLLGMCMTDCVYQYLKSMWQTLSDFRILSLI